MSTYIPDLTFVISWLENGCNVGDAIKELKILKQKIDESRSDQHHGNQYQEFDINDQVQDLVDGEIGYVAQINPLVIDWDKFGLLEAGDECKLVITAKAE